MLIKEYSNGRFNAARVNGFNADEVFADLLVLDEEGNIVDEEKGYVLLDLKLTATEKKKFIVEPLNESL